MKILKTFVFHGPNRWSASAVLEAHIEFDLMTDWPASRFAEQVTELHTTAGVVTRAISPVATPSPSIFILPFEFEEESLLRECLETAIRLCLATPLGKAIDNPSESRRLINLADDIRLGPSTRAILRAASARGIPYYRLNEGSLVQLGEGAFQRRIWTAETDATSAIAETIASDKQLTRSMLAAVGVNVPMGRSVVDREDAWRTALEIGVPVAVKPRNGNHAVGVSLDLSDRDAIMTAYDWACEAGTTTDILVEQYIAGDHHRLLVIGGKLVAAARGQREYVVGDGQRNIIELIDELNRDPRRGLNYTDQLDLIQLDDAVVIVLDKQGMTLDSIPDLNQKVLIRHVGDLVEDCTEAVHPTTRQVAILAAQTIGLDIAGMDVVATDISRPLNEQRGCIIEVNAGPSLTPHVAPLIGSPQPVGEAVVNLLYADDSPSTVPTILLVGDANSMNTSISLARNIERLGFKVGVASDSIRTASERQPTSVTENATRSLESIPTVPQDGITEPIFRELDQFHSLRLHPFLTAIVVECSANRIADKGLICRHAEFVVVPDFFFDENTPPLSESVIQATLETLGWLLASHGKLIVKGNRKIEVCQVTQRCRLPASRIVLVSNDHQAVAFIGENIVASLDGQRKPANLPNRDSENPALLNAIPG